MFGSGFVPQAKTNWHSTLKNLNLNSASLKIVLDAGDASSLPAASTKFLDLSGNGYDFFLGTTIAAEGSDPTINGTAGGASRNEYLSFDGGDTCKYDSASETFMQSWHKAGAHLSWAGWYYVSGLSVLQAVFGTYRADGTNGGITVQINLSGQYGFVAARNSASGGGAAFLIDSSLVVNTGAWNFFGGCIFDGGGTNTSFLQLNGSQQAFTCAYTTPSAANNGKTMAVGGSGGDVNSQDYIPPAGTRIANLAVWDQASISTSSMLAIYNQTKGKFGV